MKFEIQEEEGRDFSLEAFGRPREAAAWLDPAAGKPGEGGWAGRLAGRHVIFSNFYVYPPFVAVNAAADVFLWRNKKISATGLTVATAIWILFELLDYHVLTLAAYGLIIVLAILFLWSNATTFISKSPPRIPEVSIPEDLALNVALSLRYEINKTFAVLRDVVSGRDLKKFLAVIVGLWILSTVGSSCSFLTLFYIVFVLLHTVPVLYEKYEDKVDFYWDKATAELEKHCSVIHAKVMSRIPKSAQTKAKKHQ
ncbi:hypothetical protein KFK09_023258 [Dendrobium nobile]|uniref:Reticulon-like protein n=1 Tax=Dendrobium nobile TaxID=94219 RepID=A0A8T3AM99_DENNO|nr:hypothetical protein KFK09_023258 [Dendrobium nobile]